MAKQIFIGEVLSGSELAEKLPEGHAVVVFIRNGKDVVYGNVHRLPHNEDELNKNLVGARFIHGYSNSFIVKKEGGGLIRQR